MTDLLNRSVSDKPDHAVAAAAAAAAAAAVAAGAAALAPQAIYFSRNPIFVSPTSHPELHRIL